MIKTKKRQSFHFFKRFLRNPVAVGAITPSSQHLAKAMIDDLNLKPGDVILELGPGSGAFTHRIQQIIPNKEDYIGIEKDKHFVKMLNDHFPEMRIINDRAENAPNIIEQHGLAKPKVIISSLPFANKKESARNQIIRSLQSIMAPDSIFRTYQYAHAYPFLSAIQFRRTMREIFGQHSRSTVVLRNLPPAYVLTWTR